MNHEHSLVKDWFVYIYLLQSSVCKVFKISAVPLKRVQNLVLIGYKYQLVALKSYPRLKSGLARFGTLLHFLQKPNSCYVVGSLHRTHSSFSVTSVIHVFIMIYKQTAECVYFLTHSIIYSERKKVQFEILILFTKCLAICISSLSVDIALEIYYSVDIHQIHKKITNKVREEILINFENESHFCQKLFFYYYKHVQTELLLLSNIMLSSEEKLQ